MAGALSVLTRHSSSRNKIRDDRRKLHPDLVPYEALSEDDKEKDRNAVRVLLGILSEQGRVVIRASTASPDPGGSSSRAP